MHNLSTQYTVQWLIEKGLQSNSLLFIFWSYCRTASKIKVVCKCFFTVGLKGWRSHYTMSCLPCVKWLTWEDQINKSPVNHCGVKIIQQKWLTWEYQINRKKGLPLLIQQPSWNLVEDITYYSESVIPILFQDLSIYSTAVVIEFKFLWKYPGNFILPTYQLWYEKAINGKD